MSSWLTIQQAAKRIDRSAHTIYRWAREDLITLVGGRVLERQLLEADRLKRLARRGPTRRKFDA